MTKKQKDSLKEHWNIRLEKEGLGEKLPEVCKELDPGMDPDPDTQLDRLTIQKILYMITATDNLGELEEDRDVLYLKCCVERTKGQRKRVMAMAEKDPVIDMGKVNAVLFESKK